MRGTPGEYPQSLWEEGYHNIHVVTHRRRKRGGQEGHAPTPTPHYLEVGGPGEGQEGNVPYYFDTATVSSTTKSHESSFALDCNTRADPRAWLYAIVPRAYIYHMTITRANSSTSASSSTASTVISHNANLHAAVDGTKNLAPPLFGKLLRLCISILVILALLLGTHIFTTTSFLCSWMW